MIPVQVWVGWEIRKRILRDQREARKQNSIMTASLNENLTGIRVVKALRREAPNLRDFEKITEARFRSSYSATRWKTSFGGCDTELTSRTSRAPSGLPVCVTTRQRGSPSTFIEKDSSINDEVERLRHAVDRKSVV